MRYPEGNPKGRMLFFSLEEKARQGLYDDEFLAQLVDYWHMYPESEHFELFYGKYAAFYGNFHLAIEYGQRAYKKRKICAEIWNFLVECYLALGQPEKATLFQGYLNKFRGEFFKFEVPLEVLPRCLNELSFAKGIAVYAPLCRNKCSLVDGKLDEREGIFAGETIPFSGNSEGYSYWVGAYNEGGAIGAHGSLLQGVSSQDFFVKSAGADFVYDIMQSKAIRDVTVQPEGDAVILPVASSGGNQLVEFQCEGATDSALVGQWEYDFFRIGKTTRVSSAEPMMVGRPIFLSHSNERRKVVLNILVDALSWQAFRGQRFQHMPRMMEFFSRGIIFDQHFSVSEYTYPSLATIETGMYPHHSQIIQEQVTAPLDEEYVTMSERMKELGYYCVNVMGDGSGIYNGVTRGYERLLVSAYDLPAYVAADRVIRHLEAFSECDQFLFVHILELHPWSSKSIRLSPEVQTKLGLEDRMNGKEAEKPSVYLLNTLLYQMSNQKALERVDRALGGLFDYIARHYDEEEYIVQLYSDHGASIYDEAPRILSDNQTGAAYMLRGSGVPERGVVEELTSTADIYPVLGKLAGFPVGEWVDGNLPAVFGGKERECVYSNSLYPGQTYKLCIRTKEHEFCLESLEPVKRDGTVDLSGAALSLYRREGRCRVDDPSLFGWFLRRAREYTASFNNEGRWWHSAAEAGSK